MVVDVSVSNLCGEPVTVVISGEVVEMSGADVHRFSPEYVSSDMTREFRVTGPTGVTVTLSTDERSFGLEGDRCPATEP